ncbi:MAG: LiaF-related protein [Firmicutes bacterium]|nr:LiaF-related protein [Bacillota bacterium]
MRRPASRAYVLGAALIVIGLVILLKNLGIIGLNFRDLIGDYWPLLIVAVGLFWVLSPDETESQERGAVDGQDEAESSSEAQRDPVFIQEDRVDQGDLCQEDSGGTGDYGCEPDVRARELARRRNTVGWVTAIIGLLILGSSTGRWALDGSHAGGVFWAIAAVLIGLAMARSSGEPGQDGRTNWAVLSGIEHRQPGCVLRSGSYSAVCGNILLDLSVAHIPDADTYLDITAVLGGVQVILPPELPVRCEGTAILGNVNAFGHAAAGGLASRDFVRHGSDDSRGSLYIRCRSILGSSDIR